MWKSKQFAWYQMTSRALFFIISLNDIRFWWNFLIKLHIVHQSTFKQPEKETHFVLLLLATSNYVITSVFCYWVTWRSMSTFYESTGNVIATWTVLSLRQTSFEAFRMWEASSTSDAGVHCVNKYPLKLPWKTSLEWNNKKRLSAPLVCFIFSRPDDWLIMLSRWDYFSKRNNALKRLQIPKTAAFSSRISSFFVNDPLKLLAMKCDLGGGHTGPTQTASFYS